MKHRTVAGTIRYTSMKPGKEGQERGREAFRFTHHGDGSVILRASCEIEEPDPTVLRDVIYHLGPGMVPLNLHVHLTVGDAYMGSGWMRHDPATGTLECESESPSLGRISQTRPAAGTFDAFGTHPVVGDGYLARARLAVSFAVASGEPISELLWQNSSAPLKARQRAISG